MALFNFFKSDPFKNPSKIKTNQFADLMLKLMKETGITSEWTYNPEEFCLESNDELPNSETRGKIYLRNAYQQFVQSTPEDSRQIAMQYAKAIHRKK